MKHINNSTQMLYEMKYTCNEKKKKQETSMKKR